MPPTTHTFGRVQFLPGPDRGKYPHCHGLYLAGRDRRVLVDPASDRSALEALRDGPGVDEVWLSHYHEDHFAHLDLFEGLPLCIAAADAPALASLEAFFEAYGLDEPALQEAWTPLLEAMFHFRPRVPTGDLVDGGLEDLGGLTVEILATPGHTAGHVALRVPEEGLLFLGDYDLTAFGPWYGDAVSSLEDTVASVARLGRVSARRWIAAHEQGVFLEAPPVLWDAYLAVIDRREADLRKALRRPRTLPELVEERIVYRKAREPRLFYDWAEAAILRKHLARAEAEGDVLREGDRYHLQ